jgi:acetyl-CoA C-acetyltransferase
MCELKPFFKHEGLFRSGNSSFCDDGAATLVVMAEKESAVLGIMPPVPKARIVGYASVAIAPKWFTMAPAEAIRQVLEKTGQSLAKIDL